MKKILYILITIITVFSFSNVFALNKEITTLNASEENGSINVSGKAENGCLAVAIMVYKEDGETLVTMQTTSVGDDNKFSDSIKVDNGTYIVKVADYDGGTFVTKTVSIKTNPNTGDNMITYLIIGAISIVLIGFGVIYIKRKNN